MRRGWLYLIPPLAIVGGFQLMTWRLLQTFHFQAALGRPDLILWGWHYYGPWRGVVWTFRFSRQARPQFEAAMVWAIGGVLLGIVLAGVLRLTARKAPTSGVYGQARWATREEIRKGGLLR